MGALRMVCVAPISGLARNQAGFTLVELVLVMTLIAIVSAVGMSRFANREPFAVQSVSDQLVSGLRLAQNTAMARRATVYITITASPPAMQVCADVGCTQPLSPPGGGNWLNDAQGLVLSTGATFTYAGDGTPSFNAQQVITVQTSDGSIAAPPVRVESGSGHVHSP